MIPTLATVRKKSRSQSSRPSMPVNIRTAAAMPWQRFTMSNAAGKEGFIYGKFFELCRNNGLPDDKVSMYEGQVEAKRLGSQGRARMTLRNMLATIVRRDGKLKDLDGDEVDIALPKTVLTGAAAAAKAKQEAANEPTGERKF